MSLYSVISLSEDATNQSVRLRIIPIMTGLSGINECIVCVSMVFMQTGCDLDNIQGLSKE